MQTVRQKWQLYKTYQRLQRLWEEYLLASSQEESPAMTVQLNEFLTAFEEAYAEWTQVSLSTHISATLDKLYGDCSEILVNLLYTIERVVNQHKPKTAMSDTNNCCDDELIGKALNVSRLILQEEKYRRVVLDTPNLTTRILALLNKLKSTTTRRYAIRVLLALSQEDDAKLEIGRHQGFRKILLLVSQNDDTLTAEVIHTIKRLAETQNEVRVSTTIAEEIDDSLPTHFSALIGVAVGDKVTSLVSDVRDIMSFELGRVFPHLGSPGNSTRGRVDYFHNNPTTTDHKCDFVPNAATIEHWLDSLQIDPNEPLHLSRMNSHGNNNSSSSSNTAHVTTNSISTENQTIFGRWRNLVGLGKQRPAEMEAAHTERRESEESSNRIAMDQVNEPTKNAKVIRDLLRQQNALRSLTKILQSRNNLSSASRLELVEIICKLLFNHPTSQLLFHQIDGYSAILEDLNRPWKADKAYRYDNDLPTSYGVEEEDDDNDENEEGEEEEEEEEEDDNGDEDTVKEGSDEDKEELWYRDYFNLLFTIALGLTPDLKITHIEAADLLFRIATEATQLKARRHALYCIQDLITVNPFNAVVGWKCGGVDRLIRMLTTSASTQGNDIVLAKQMGLDPESQYTGSDHGSIVDIERATALEKIVDASLLWQYIASITWLLEYFSVLLSEHNLYILNEYTRILMQITLPSYNVVVGMILRSVGRLLTDQLCRQNAVEPRFLNIYLQLLRRAYHLKDSVSDTDENPNVAELLEHSMLINPHDMQTIESTRRAMVQEQYLALLQIIGMLIEATGRDMELVKVNQGFQILHDAVALSTTLCWKIPQNNDSNAPFELDYDHEYERLVCDMAMWLLRECLLCKNATSDGIKWLVKLLKLVLASLTSTLKTTWIIDENDTGHEEDSMTAPHTKKAVRPFRFSFSWFHVKICQLLSSVFRRSNLAKRHFGELGGIEALLTVLSQTRDLNVATCALIAVGDLFAGGEETKQLLGETFGYEGFMELVLSSQRPLDRLCCQILLEVATVGSVVRDLSKVDRDEEPFHLSGAVIPFIAGLLVPTVLFEGPLPFYEGRKPGLQTPSLERLVSNSRPGSQRPAQSASRPSSIFSDGNRRHRDTSSSIGDLTTRGQDSISMFSARPRSIAGPLMDMRTEALLEDLASDPYGQIPSPCFSPPPPPPPESIQASNHSQHHHSGSGIRTLSLHRKSSLDVTSQVDHSLGGSDTPLAKRLIGVVFRDRYAANMALKLLFRVTAGGHELELYYFDLLMQLLHINPQNQQLMCAHEGLEWMVRSTICGILSGSTTLPPTSLANLIALIGSHDIGPGEAALLLNAIYDPLRVAENAPYGPRLEDNLQVTSQTVAELQRELLLALLEIASRLDPVYMFSFDGAGALLSFPLDKLPGQKFGYTLSCWLKVTVFLGDDTGFLCYEDPQGCFFELYLRRLAQSNRCCLCVRTQQHPMPPEDFVFYGYDFANASDWHHIALAHSRQEMTLFVNGQLTQTCNTFHYPRVSSKERICMGVVGRRGHGLTTGEYFCGQLSGITFFEGIWDGSVARRVFDHGLRYGDNLRAQLNIEHREALVIDPKTCFVELASSYASNNNHPFINTHHYGHNGASVSTAPITSNTTVNPAMMVTNIANIATPMMNSNTAITTTNITHTETPPPCYTRLAGCSVHYMRKLGDVISQVGGPQVCFPMMETSLEYQLIGLNIVVCLLLKSPMNREQFTVSSGFHVIRHLLATSRWPLTMDHFELLLDISCDGHTEHAHRLLVHWEGMDMYTDLLLRAPENVQLEAIHLLVNVLLDLRKNLAWWRAGPGFVLLFDLLLTLPVSQHQFLFRLLDAMMEDLSSTELRHLLDFIAYEKRQYLDHKCEVLDLLLRHATWNQHLVELLSSVNGLTLLISFLDLPSERFRLLVLKLLGVLMSSNVRQSRTLMTRVNGFDAMWLFLAPFPVTSDLVQTLLGVALNFYRCDQSTNIASNNNNNTANTSLPTLGVRKPILRLSLQLTDTLVYPELIRLLLELLRACDNINLMFDLLADVKRMLTPDNMVTLWEHPWPEWFAVFLQDRGVMEKSNYGRIASMVHAIAQRMMVFDMARRISIINRLKGAVAESETFQLQLIDDVLAYYERRPCLDTETASEVLKNLAVLYRHLDEYQPPNATIYLRFAGCLNQIACHNAAETRNIMKTVGLFHIRDALIINLLQADLSTLEQVNVFGKFSFEMLADQPRFRESHGLLLLMRAFHLAEPTIRSMIARILLSVFRPSAENRRAITAIIEDYEVIRRFFTVSLRDRSDEEFTRSSIEDEVDYLEDSNHGASSSNRTDSELGFYANNHDWPSPRISNNGGGGTGTNSGTVLLPMTLSEFLAWYFQSDSDAILRRGKIEQHIETLYAPVATVYRRAQERVFARRQKRIQHFREKQLRHASALNRALADLKAKGKQRMDLGATSHRQRMEAQREARHGRFKAGEESWRLRVHNAATQTLMAATNTASLLTSNNSGGSAGGNMTGTRQI